MAILFSIQNSFGSAAPRPDAASQPWWVGQIVQATVLQRLSAGAVRLAVNGTSVVARSGLALRFGQQLTLRVVSLGSQPVLAVLTDRRANERNSPQPYSSLGGVAPSGRDRLLSPFLNSLAWLSNNGNRYARLLPQAVREATLSVLASMPTPDLFRSSEHLRPALLSSGLFLEAMLAHTAQGLPVASAIATDFKGSLLRLRMALARYRLSAEYLRRDVSRDIGAPRVPAPEAVENSLPLATARGLCLRLGAGVESVVQRIEAGQLWLACCHARGERIWNFLVPFFDGGRVALLELEVEQQRTMAGRKGAPAWRFTLVIDSIRLGWCCAQAALVGRSVALQLWAARPATANSFAGQRQELERRLADAGFCITRLRCAVGKPSRTPGSDGMLFRVGE